MQIQSTDSNKQVYSYDNSMMLFTSRWAALSIDIAAVFIVFFTIKMNIPIINNWPLFIFIYTVLHILLPLFMTKSRSIGKIIMRVNLIYPESYSISQRKIFYALRELIKGASILVTAGLILIITPLIISEKSKPTLHEKFTKVIAKRKLGKNDLMLDDGFDGKLKL